MLHIPYQWDNLDKKKKKKTFMSDHPGLEVKSQASHRGLVWINKWKVKVRVGLHNVYRFRIDIAMSSKAYQLKKRHATTFLLLDFKN